MVSNLVVGLISFLPGMLVLYLVIGAYEQHFRHKAMFLAIIGGLVLGLLIAVAEAFVMSDAALLFVILAFPVMETLGKAALLGLPRFQDEPETVLLGGAVGATVAPMLLMMHVQFVAEVPLVGWLLVNIVGAAVGLTGAHVVSGMVLGQGPARGSVLGSFLPSLAWLLPADALFVMLASTKRFAGRSIGEFSPLQGDALWALLLAGYGLLIMVWRSPDLVREGLPADARRAIRREKLKEAREGR